MSTIPGVELDLILEVIWPKLPSHVFNCRSCREICHRGQLLERTPFMTLLRRRSFPMIQMISDPLDIKCRHTSDTLVHRNSFVGYIGSYISSPRLISSCKTHLLLWETILNRFPLWVRNGKLEVGSVMWDFIRIWTFEWEVKHKWEFPFFKYLPQNSSPSLVKIGETYLQIHITDEIFCSPVEESSIRCRVMAEVIIIGMTSKGGGACVS